MLRTILTPSTHMRLQDIATIQERHFPIRFDPNLEPRMGANHPQSRHM